VTLARNAATGSPQPRPAPAPAERPPRRGTCGTAAPPGPSSSATREPAACRRLSRSAGCRAPLTRLRNSGLCGAPAVRFRRAARDAIEIAAAARTHRL